MDDLLDLNFTSSTSRTSGKTAGAFESLAAAQAKPGSSLSRAPTPSTRPPPVQAKPASSSRQQPVRASGDAFSDLLSSLGPAQSGTSSNGTTRPSSRGLNDSRASPGLPSNGFGSQGLQDSMAGLSLVERQARVAREKKEQEERERKAFDFDAWGDTLGSTSSTTNLSGSNAQLSKDNASSVLQPIPTKVVPSKPTNPPFAVSKNTFGDFDDLLNTSPRKSTLARPTTQASSSSRPGSADPWDFDSLNQPPSTQRAHKAEPLRGIYTAGDDEDDDLLGELGRPARHSDAPRNGSASDRDLVPKTARSFVNTRSTSPPPHVVGQIVEMGFSPSQARDALAKTEDGVNVEAAVAMLLGEHGRDDEHRMHEENRAASRKDHDANDAITDQERMRERQRRRRQGPTRATLDQRPTQGSPDPESKYSQDVADMQAQADKILAQASEIGFNMFNKANSLWSQGKERAQKLLEERQRQQATMAKGASSGTEPSDAGRVVRDGRPRWMIDAEATAEHEQAHRASTQPKRGESRNGKARQVESFKDSDDEVEGPEDPVARRPGPSRQQPTASKSDTVDLFGQDRPVYKSAARRKPLAGSPHSSTPVPSVLPAATARPLKKREVPPLTPSQVSESASNKGKGNDLFKLGRFEDAHKFYSMAIECLPDNHILLVPLLNNRAATLLKQGEHQSAISDCTRVITLIGLDYHPSLEQPLDDPVLQDVKLSDGLFKALSKRAGAYEMAEKWNKAKEDWETLIGHHVVGVQGANGRKLVSDGLKRSKQMTEGGMVSKGPVSTGLGASSAPSGRAPSRQAPARRPSPPTDVSASKNVSKMRQAAQVQETEDAERIALTGAVDAKIQTWSGGKETNLRGLLSSLDLVLWKELGVKVPGMAELITEKQVKIGYMKVIGRLHPDKVSKGHQWLYIFKFD